MIIGQKYAHFVEQSVLRSATNRAEMKTNRPAPKDSVMSKTDWIKDTKAAANDCETNMPWTRGLRRQAMIAKHLDTETPRSKITLPPMPPFMSSDITK